MINLYLYKKELILVKSNKTTGGIWLEEENLSIYNINDSFPTEEIITQVINSLNSELKIVPISNDFSPSAVMRHYSFTKWGEFARKVKHMRFRLGKEGGISYGRYKKSRLVENYIISEDTFDSKAVLESINSWIEN